MCEGFSGIKQKRNGVEPEDENSRYKSYNRHETTANLKHLNLADLKQITVILINPLLCLPIEQSNEKRVFQPIP